MMTAATMRSGNKPFVAVAATSSMTFQPWH
jgi:hypothetical protein